MKTGQLWTGRTGRYFNRKRDRVKALALGAQRVLAAVEQLHTEIIAAYGVLRSSGWIARRSASSFGTTRASVP